MSFQIMFKICFHDMYSKITYEKVFKYVWFLNISGSLYFHDSNVQQLLVYYLSNHSVKNESLGGYCPIWGAVTRNNWSWFCSATVSNLLVIVISGGEEMLKVLTVVTTRWLMSRLEILATGICICKRTLSKYPACW